MPVPTTRRTSESVDTVAVTAGDGDEDREPGQPQSEMVENPAESLALPTTATVAQSRARTRSLTRTRREREVTRRTENQISSSGGPGRTSGHHTYTRTVTGSSIHIDMEKGRIDFRWGKAEFENLRMRVSGPDWLIGGVLGGATVRATGSSDERIHGHRDHAQPRSSGVGGVGRQTQRWRWNAERKSGGWWWHNLVPQSMESCLMLWVVNLVVWVCLFSLLLISKLLG